MNICIGREFGSGGHEIAAYLAKSLEMPFYDQELVKHAVSASGLNEQAIASADETKENPFLHQVYYSSPDRKLRGLSAHKITAKLQSEFILAAATENDCVFVGRCADYVLKQAGIRRISIFISAPFENRVRRKAELTGKDEKAVIALVKRTDLQRQQYYNAQTGQSWGKPSNYDLCINSSSLGVEQTAEAILRVLEKWKKGELV